jgi:epoxyqueuosine reductase
MESILKEISLAGLEACAVPVSRLNEMKREFEKLHESGGMDEELYKDRMRRCRFDAEEAEGMAAVLSVAMPSPVCRAVFRSGGKEVTATVPPTYRDYVSKPPEIEKTLNGILGRYGYRAVRAKRLPEKLLAAHSGLAEYGRNNVAYVKGLGSFVFLSSYFTDMPCGVDAWGPARRMPLCDTCAKCLEACPTGAIRRDRNVIEARRCLTMHNEEDSAVPFPGWISPSAHNSLIGCTACQFACPVNAKRMDLIEEPVEFAEDETALLLAGAPPEGLPEKMVGKMDRLDMRKYYEPIARNLKALFAV